MAVSGVSDTIGELKVKLAAELDNSTLEKLLTICDVKPAQKEEIKQSDHRYLAFLNYFQQTTTEDNEFVDELEKMFNKVERRRPAHMVALFKASIHRKRVMFETQSEYSAGHNDCEDDDDEYFSLDETVPTKYRPEYSKDHTICEDDHHDHDEDKDEEYFSSDETVHPKYRSDILEGKFLEIEAQEVEQRSKEFDKLKEKIGLKEWTENGVIKLHRVLRLRSCDCKSTNTLDVNNVIATFFSRLMSSDHRSVSIFKTLCQSQVPKDASESSKDTNWLTILHSTDTNVKHEHVQNHISCRDSICAILHCCDYFLRQQILSKMSACQLAVPVLLPNISKPGVQFLLWELQQISKTWVDGSETVETGVTNYPFPAVASVRFGDINVSKSQILNTILGQVQGNANHSYFMSSNEDGAAAVLSRGTLEITWLVPNNNTLPNAFRLIRPMCFLNLRGSSLSENASQQEKFILEYASCVIVFINKARANDYESKLEHFQTKCSVILVVTSNDPTAPLGQPVTKKCKGLTMLLCEGCNILPIAEEISKLIGQSLQTHKKSLTLSKDGTMLCEQLHIQNSILNKDCSVAEKIVRRIFDSIQTEDPKTFKSRLFTLQPHWKKWTQFFKDRKYKESGSEHELDKYFTQMIEEREKQIQIPLVLEMKAFCEALLNLSVEQVQFLIHWITIYSNEWVLRTHMPLLKELMSNTDESKRNGMILQLAEHSFGVEYFFREIGQMYECRRDLSVRGKDIQMKNAISFSEIISKVAEMILMGIPIEIFDGDVSNVPLEWIQSVLEELKGKVNNARIVTISVLGMQSSGKSTLLNNLFGVNFRVASGRCTRGISIQLLETDRRLQADLKCDFVILIDTEGLGSPEKSQKDGLLLDNELATFSICLSDLTLINIRGEYMGKELSNILQIAAHAFIRMNIIKLKPACLIIQQAVSDPKAYEKNYNNEQIIFRELDEAVVVAAKYENKSDQFKCFTDIFNVTRGHVYDYNIHYIPCLSQCTMGPVNSEYSDKIIALKSEILKLLRDRTDNHFLDEFTLKIKDLWMAVIQEDFVFSFRNSAEAIQYEEFSSAYNGWILQVRHFIMDWELAEEENIKSSTSEEVRRKFEDVKQNLDVIIANKKDEVLQKIDKYIEDSPYGYTEDFKQSFERSLNTYTEDTKVQVKNNLKRTFHMVLNQKATRRQLVSEVKSKLLEKVLSVAKEMTEKCKEHNNTEGPTDEAIKAKFDTTWKDFVDNLKSTVEILSNESIEESIKTKILSTVSGHLTKLKKRQFAEKLRAKDLSDYHIPLISVKNTGDHRIITMSVKKRSNSIDTNLEKFKLFLDKQKTAFKDSARVLSTISSFTHEECTTTYTFQKENLATIPDHILEELAKYYSNKGLKTRSKINIELSVLESCQVKKNNEIPLDFSSVSLQIQHFKVEISIDKSNEDGSSVDSYKLGATAPPFVDFFKTFTVILYPFNYKSESIIEMLLLRIDDLMEIKQNDDSFDFVSTMTCIFSSIIFYIQDMVRSHYLYQIMKCKQCYRAVFAEDLFSKESFMNLIQKEVPSQHIAPWSQFPSMSFLDKSNFYDLCSKKLDTLINSSKGSFPEYKKLIKTFANFVHDTKQKTKRNDDRDKYETYLYKRLAERLYDHFLHNSYEKWVKKVDKICERSLWNIQDIKSSFFDLLKIRKPSFPFELIAETVVTDKRFSELPWEIPEIQNLDVGLITNLSSTNASSTCKSILQNLSSQKQKLLTSLQDSQKFNAHNFESAVQDLTSTLKNVLHLDSLDMLVGILHFSAWALPICVESDILYEKENNILALLDNERKKNYEEFKNACLNRYDDHRHARELFNFILPHLQASAKNKTCTALFGKLLTFTVFHSRRQLIAEILRELCGKEKFEEYVRFLNHTQDFLNDWALQYICDLFMKNEVSIRDAIEFILEDIFDKTERSLRKTIDQIDIETPQSSKSCIQHFLKKMSENVKITCDSESSRYLCESIRIHNPEHFVKHFSDVLRNSRTIIHSYIGLHNTTEKGKLMEWIHTLRFDLHIELISQVSGCREQCPFCKASCDKTVDHDIHFSELHYPIGLAGFRKIDDKNTLVEAICTSRIASSRSYRFGTGEYKAYKNYKDQFKSWDIKPQYEDQPTMYWKWVLKTFNEHFAAHYNAQPAKIPSGWNDITKQDALKSINKTYRLTAIRT